tara:strand:- start:4910 stop:5068 length:159 start_codon:yes stop_codon:yes gene_type:complete
MLKPHHEESAMNPKSTEDKDVTEGIVHIMHIALPITGVILIFLMAFIAVFMA